MAKTIRKTNQENYIKTPDGESEKIKSKKGKGRPRVIIDNDYLKSLCEMQCSTSEICSALGVSDETLSRWVKKNFKMSWLDFKRKYSDAGNISVRARLYKAAKDPKGDAQLLRFYMKNYMNMSDNPKQDLISQQVSDGLVQALQLSVSVWGDYDGQLPLKNKNIVEADYELDDEDIEDIDDIDDDDIDNEDDDAE